MGENYFKGKLPVTYQHTIFKNVYHSIIRDIPPSTKLYASYQILSHPDCNDNLEDLNGNDLEEENFFGRFLSQIAGPNTDEKTKGGGISLDKAQVKITLIIIGTLVFLFLIMWLCGKCQKKTKVSPVTSKMANNEIFPPEILVLDSPAMSHLSTYSNHGTTTAIVEKTEMIPPEILEEILQFQENTLEKTKAELEKVKDERNNLEKQLAEIIFAQNIPTEDNGNNIRNNESILNRMILDCDKIIYELNEKIESLKQEEDEIIDNVEPSPPKVIPLELLKQIQEGKKLKKAENKNETESAIEISAGVVVQDPRAAIVEMKEALNKTVDNNMDADDSDENCENDQNDDRIQSSHSTHGSSPMDQNGFDIDLLTTEDPIEDSSSPPPCLQNTPPPPPYVINVQSEPIFPSAPNSPSSHSSPILPPSSAVSTPSPPPSTPPNPTTPPSPPFTAIPSAPPSTPPCSPSSALPSAPPSPSTPPSTAKDLDTPWINP